MKTWKISVICILLAFLCSLSAIGFASLSSSMEINGTVKVDIPYGLFITSVTTRGMSSVDSNSVSFIQNSTAIDSTVDKKNNVASTVTYTVTVLNNTKLTYSYRGIYYQTNLTGYNGNNSVDTANGDRKIGVTCSLATVSAENKKVAPGETLTFTVTYTFGKRMDANTQWKTLVNIQFGINVDGEREALEVVEDKFLNILNTNSTYHQLIDALDNKFDGSQEWTSNYIGNVTGS